MRNPVSVLIITSNEENYIERCLESVGWADEIVVVDAHSEDKTKDICLTPGRAWSSQIQFHERAWTGFNEQRNYSLELAKNEWVLVMDADEACSPELKERILGILSEEKPEFDAYKVHRQEYFLGKKIYYGIWNPSYQDRFFKRTGISYVNNIHEYPVFPKEPGRIHEVIEHAPDFHPDKFLYKMNKYTTIEARDRVKAGRRTNVFRIFFAFFAMFWKNYFYYKAYRDGYHGFVISILEGISRAVRHVKIWQFQSAAKETESSSRSTH